MSDKNYYEKYWQQKTPQKNGHVTSFPDWPQKELDNFYKNVEQFIGESVLDIGAGEGTVLSFLKQQKKFKKLTGLEISKEAIKRGKDKHNWIKYINTSADTAMPIESNSFDTILMTDVIEHLIDIDTLLSECKRILRKGGHIIIITPDYNFLKQFIIGTFFWNRFFYPTNPHIRFFTRKLLQEVMKDHGFNEVFYKWGLTWFNLMPQNMHTVYEKK